MNAAKGDSGIRKINPNKLSWITFDVIRRVAAIFLILFCLGILYQVLNNPPKVEVVEKQAHIIKRANPAGKKSLISLSDGTKVYLNSDSEISYGSEFSDSLRHVSLKGEAFFEVAKESRPFVVETQGTKIRVLGTSFNVN